MASCPKCGTQATTKFCPNCGAPVAEAPAMQAPPPAPPQGWGQTAATTMAPPPGTYAPQQGTYPPQAAYAPQQGTYAPQQSAPVSAPRGSIWQGVTALVISLLFGLWTWLGISSTGFDDWNAVLGAIVVNGFAAVLVLPFGLWALFKNRKAGKVMGGIGVGFTVATLLFFVILYS